MFKRKGSTSLYMNEEAWDMARTVEPDLRRLLCVARPRIAAEIERGVKDYPCWQRPLIRLAWWPVVRIVTPIYLRLHVEFFMQRLGKIPLESCSEWLQRAQAGECAGEWDRKHQHR
jgi:hypothetical protein